MGIGFATPSKMAEWIISKLRQDGKVIRGWIGITIKPAPFPKQGILISRIVENSPAQQAGIKAGDIITKFNTLPLTGATNLSRIIAESTAGEIINFEIIRDGNILNIQVHAATMPDSDTTPQPQQPKPEKDPSDINSETPTLPSPSLESKIGRASCRERV